MKNQMQSLLQPLALLLSVFLLTPSALAAAQGDDLQFNHLLAEQGIATGAVEAIYQDSYGYIWFGGTAGGGVVQYNGYDFTIHNHRQGDPRSLSNGVVWDIFEDSTGDIWIATDVGINRFDRNLGQFTHFRPARTDREGAFARAIVEDVNGTLWVGFMGGLGRFDRETETFRMYFHEPGSPNALSSNNIRSMFAGRDGNLWIGTEGGGLNRFDLETEQFEQSRPNADSKNSIAGSTVLGLYQTSDGMVWAGTDNGLSRLNPATGQFKNFRHDSDNPPSLHNNINIVSAFAEDSQGNLWVGTEYGLHYLDRKTGTFSVNLSNPSKPRSLAHNAVRSLHMDTHDGLWVGYFPSGISYLDRTSVVFSTYRHDPDESNGLSQSSVLSLQEDPNGGLWIGTDGGGLNHLDREKGIFSHYQNNPKQPQSLSANAVLTLSPAADMQWWIGTWYGGLNLFNPKTKSFKHFRQSTTGPADNVWAVLEDSRGTLWVGTIGAGLSRYDHKQGKFLWYPVNPDKPGSFPSYVVWSLYEDHRGQIWVGTGDGLSRYVPETDSFVTYSHDINVPTSLSSDVVDDITEDKQNRLWIATRGGGLNLYDPQTDSFSRIDQSNGLPSNVVVSVVADDIGNLWLGTANGLSRYTPATGQVLNYSQKNGLQGNQFNIGSALKLRSGELAFGGIYGFTVFDPADFNRNESAPPVEIVEFEIFNRPVSVGTKNSPLNKTISHTDAITLSHEQSVFSFTFVALSYSDPQRNEYAYKLEGFEDQWNYVDNRRMATYTNLDPGNYVFRVKAANSQGVWNEEGRSIRLHILPPPWKTWWAYVFYLLLIIGAVLAFVRAQVKKVDIERKITRELELKVAERTDALQQKHHQLAQAYQKLEEISLSDPLTGLSNRRYLQKLIPMDVAEVHREVHRDQNRKSVDEPGQDLVFLLLDVDHFKSVNDIHGHTAGDQILIQMSSLLTNISRDSDFLVRWGGEEFLIVSRFSHREDAPQMADRIRQAVAEYPFTLGDGQVLQKTCSIGYACYPFLRDQPLALSWEQVIDTADKALYAVKKSGRNRCAGIAATDRTPNAQLYKHITEDINGMIARGEIDVIIGSGDEPVTF
jgi:diguanylate cyclase (GGDEF)-like protein